MTRGISKRDGRPAYENAPPRMRASGLVRVFDPKVEVGRPGFAVRLAGFALSHFVSQAIRPLIAWRGGR